MTRRQIGRRPVTRAVLAVATVALLVSGCTASSTDPETACDGAVAQAMATDPGSDTVDALDSAIARCGSLEAWVAAANRYPDTAFGQDPVAYAITRCRTSAQLAGTDVCSGLPGQEQQ